MTAGLQRRQPVLSISTEIGLRVLKALQPLHVFPPVRKPSYIEQTREVRCQRHIEDDRCQEQIRQTQIAGDERGLALRLIASWIILRAFSMPALRIASFLPPTKSGNRW